MLVKIIKLLGTVAVASATLQASNFSFQGNFASDDQVQLFNFAIASTGTVTLINFGYGGGTNGVPVVIPAGGFDNLLTLYQSDGTEIGSFDDDPGCAHTNLNHGACLDAYYSNTLSAGSYILALTQSGNDPNGDFSTGFSQQGTGNFTAGNCSPSHPFCDAFGNPNNGKWALDIRGVNSAFQVPEPVSMSLGACGLALIGILYRRHRSSSKHELISGEKA